MFPQRYGPHPFALAPLRNAREQQPYDICVSLTLPPSPVNQAKGNFMVALHLLDSSDDGPLCGSEPPSKKRLLETAEILDTFRRTALMPYMDPTIALVYRVLLLPLNMLRGVEERVVLTTSMVEQSVLDHSGKLPNMMLLEVEAGNSLQVHSASITVTAQLGGLRWIMHRHWMTSFVVLTLTFWSIEVLFTFLVWLALSHFFGCQDGVLQMLSDAGRWSSSSVPPEEIKREFENGRGSDVAMKEEDNDCDTEEKPDKQLACKDDGEDNSGKAG